MNTDLPFVVEYAKSSIFSCETCKMGIKEGSLKIGVIVQALSFDGKITMWHHSKCLLGVKKLTKVEDIADFASLRWEDQKLILDHFGKEESDGTKPKGSRENQSDRAACREYLEKINVAEIPISKFNTNSLDAACFDSFPGWYDAGCSSVKTPRQELDVIEATDKYALNGYIVVVIGKFEGSGKDGIEKKVINLGGVINTEVTSAVSLVISTESEVAKDSMPILKSCELDIHVVSPKFLQDVEYGAAPADAIEENSIVAWGSNPILKFGEKQDQNYLTQDTSSLYSSCTKNSTIKMAVKGGATVDYVNVGKEPSICTKPKRCKENPSDFSVGYAKSIWTDSRECDEKIPMKEVQISEFSSSSPDAAYFDSVLDWHPADYSVKHRQELATADNKRKVEEKYDASFKRTRKEEKALLTQNILLSDMKDKLKESLTKKDMITLLEFNNQHVSVSKQNLYEHLSDCLLFGAIKACPQCKNSRPRFKLEAYRCSGNITEWTKCQYVTDCPEREPFKIPEEFKEKFDFLRDYKYIKRDRLLPKTESPSSIVTKGPLTGYFVALIGKFEESDKGGMEKKVTNLGGKIRAKVTRTVSLVVSTKVEVARNNVQIFKSQELDIHVVSPKFLEDVKNGATPVAAIQENSICEWGGDPVLKFGIKQEKESVSQVVGTSGSSSSCTKKSTLKMPVEGSATVDPESRKGNTCHIYVNNGTTYNCVLGAVDIARDVNAYYKLQLLESNDYFKYYLFRSWGRVGTAIGGSKTEKLNSVSDAILEFERLFLEKTGNDWNHRKNFVKQPNLMYPLDIDYGEEADDLQELKPSGKSELSKPVQNLICLIFDIKAMKNVMTEFQIDLKKMPLGKLSKNQIEKAYSILNEAQQILFTGCNSIKVMDASNRFYTLIPHSFGLKQPPLLDNEELIKSKIEMLDSLLEIEFAYKMFRRDCVESTKDPVNEHYKKLNTDIEVLEETSDEFRIINTYLQNTHAIHRFYSIVLNKVFKINRHGESDRYRKFKNLHNKKLLWHGSRLTNYVGILSQGLRIAPPEAPSTGYMFGKGIYFADVVSKSANYCHTTGKNSTALLLLCEVALGNMYEKIDAEFIQTLPGDKHSTKGMGMTVPNPKHKTFLGDVEVPYGKPVKTKISSVLMYNEYIVYDVNQVNIKYLLEVKLK